MYIKGQKRKKEKIKNKKIYRKFLKNGSLCTSYIEFLHKKADPSKVCFISYFR